MQHAKATYSHKPTALGTIRPADDDLEHIRERRRPENRLGFALQLYALRYTGRALTPGELTSQEILSFIGAQLGILAYALLTYAARRQTHQQHMEALRNIYGYKAFAGRGARDVRDWLFDQAEEARSNEDLAQRFVAQCREVVTILPAVSRIERLCADAAVSQNFQTVKSELILGHTYAASSAKT